MMGLLPLHTIPAMLAMTAVKNVGTDDPKALVEEDAHRS